MSLRLTHRDHCQRHGEQQGVYPAAGAALETSGEQTGGVVRAGDKEHQGDQDVVSKEDMMLPKELLMVWKRKGTIRPRYLSDMTVAGEIIQVFTQYQGKKYKEILRQLEGMEGDDFKLVRGMGTLLERRCRFQSGSEVQGKEVRVFLYDKGFVKTTEERNHLLEEASLYFHVPEGKVEEAMFSDLE